MAFAYDRLVDVTTLPKSVGILFDQPASQVTYIRFILLHNSNTTAEVVKLYDVPDNGGSVGSAGATNEFFGATLQPLETVMIEFPVPGKIIKDEHETIQGVTTTASKVTCTMYGGKE